MRDAKLMRGILKDEFILMYIDLSHRYFIDQKIQGQLHYLFQYNMTYFKNELEKLKNTKAKEYKSPFSSKL